MAVSIMVKNTFLNVRSSAEGPVKRSSSLPRAFKPTEFALLSESCCDDFHSARSDDSTSVSDVNEIENMLIASSDSDSQDFTHEDFPDYCTDCTDDDFDYLHSDLHMCLPCNDFHAAAPLQVGLQATDSSKSGMSLFSMVPQQEQSPKSMLSLSGMVENQQEASNNAVPCKTTLSLADMVDESSEKERIKLKSTARPFKSVREPPAEAKAVVVSAVEVLSAGPDIYDVQVRDGGMGGTTVIIAKSSLACPDPSLIFSLVKDALLTSAEQTDSTYILGYGSQPFKNLDDLSFSASVVCVPAAHQDSVCWETYEQGFCPRCTGCRWNHPSEIDKMHIIVMIQKGACEN